ncbi:MAG: hypothetical protein LBC27_10335 [Spirochaetaceae bacterium]|jgi:hypothetical protein|nr:hypothetical protein [Spirochaetaceae bacterium]
MNKKFLFLVIPVCLLALSLMFAACGDILKEQGEDVIPSKLVGRWAYRSIQIFQINSDGSGTFGSGGTGQDCVWSVSNVDGDDMLDLNISNTDIGSTRYSVSGRTLKFLAPSSGVFANKVGNEFNKITE